MAILILVVGVVAVVVIALVFVGQGVGKTNQMPAQIVVDVHEAIAFCAEALPDEVTAVVSYDELRRALRLHLEWIQAYHWAPDRGADETGPVVFAELDALDYVMERADITQLSVSRDHMAAIIESHSAYLQVMGAIHLEDPVTVERDLSELPVPDTVAELAGPIDDEHLPGVEPPQD